MKRIYHWRIMAATLVLLGVFGPGLRVQADGNFTNTIDRSLRYHPEGKDFVIVNGTARFNRPLYGVNDAFKVQAGDRPEFALFKDAKYGVLQIGVVTPLGTQWLPDMQKVTARYRAGEMDYECTDPVLGTGTLMLTVLPRSDADGVIVRGEYEGLKNGGVLNDPKGLTDVSVVWAYGGLSGERLQRGGDEIGGKDLGPTYALRPGDCANNVVQIAGNTWTLTGPRGVVHGAGARESALGISDATQLATPATAVNASTLSTQDSAKTLPGNARVMVGQRPLGGNGYAYISVALGPGPAGDAPEDLAGEWAAAEKRHDSLANRVVVDTPDPYINASASAYVVAGDAIWESPHYMHGANAWRSPLLGWRGPYVADVLGWHDRAETHLSYWANKQNTDASDLGGKPTPDPAKNLGENDGKSLHSYGAIPATHYDMAMVYIDELLWHYKWTGDRAYLKKTWPTIKLELAWEKRELDRDGLYEAYAAIWASDAMQYNGGGTAHASAYNYLHFKMAARIAKMLGEDPAPYIKEAYRIQTAMNAQLWLPKLGWYAEYKDILGLKLVHPAAAVYSVYHVIDSEVPDPFQAYEMLRYVDTQIPHIPVRGPGVPAGQWSVVSSSNWLPYQWSLNNVVLAETEHTALAYWQAGQADKAFALWKGGVLDSMYMGLCPGDIPNLSQYDVNRGESYRDFGDAIGIGSRAFIEGLFGILPDALDGTLTLRPGFPSSWDHASITTPDISYSFKRTIITAHVTENNPAISDTNTIASRNREDTYLITPKFPVPMGLTLKLTAPQVGTPLVTVNGKPAKWSVDTTAVGAPVITITASAAAMYDVNVAWQGVAPAIAFHPAFSAINGRLDVALVGGKAVKISDPQNTLFNVKLGPNAFTATVTGEPGARTAFAQVKQGDMTWWRPIDLDVRPPYVIVPGASDAQDIRYRIQNNTATPIKGNISVQVGTDPRLANSVPITIPAGGESSEIETGQSFLLPGTIPIHVAFGGKELVSGQVTDWHLPARDNGGNHLETVNMDAELNDSVTQIFKNDYLTPRSPYTSLQIPIHAIGSWSSPTAMAEINDSGLRRAAGANNVFVTPQGIPFGTTGQTGAKNIAFTSQWDNYPRSVSVPLTGNASHVYLLMAGSTAPMQSRLDNGEVTVTYTDGTQTRLALNNPSNWWPIDVDYSDDDYAFKRDSAYPPRVALRTGTVYTPAPGGGGNVNGGAATVLDMPLDPARTLKSLSVGTLANDVVIGLMSVTLAR